MIVPENNGRHDYIGNGATEFAYSFGITDAGEIEVLLNGMAPTGSYSVSGIGNETGGMVTFQVAPANGVAITLLRRQPIQQLSRYTPNEDFPSKRIEMDLGKLTAVAQMLAERIRRAVTLPKQSTSEGLVLPDAVPGDSLRWRSDLTGFENWRPAPGTVATPLAIADGGTSAQTIQDAQNNLGITSQAQGILAAQVMS